MALCCEPLHGTLNTNPAPALPRPSILSARWATRSTGEGRIQTSALKGFRVWDLRLFQQTWTERCKISPNKHESTKRAYQDCCPSKGKKSICMFLSRRVILNVQCKHHILKQTWTVMSFFLVSGAYHSFKSSMASEDEMTLKSDMPKNRRP